MRFHRSTKSVVQGNALRAALRRHAAQDSGTYDDYDAQEEQSSKDEPREKKTAGKRRRGVAVGCILAAAAAAILAGLYLLPGQAEQLLPEGQVLLALPVEGSLCGQISPGDILRLCDSGGAIPALRYVSVAAAGSGSVSVLLSQRQLDDFLRANGQGEIFPVLVIHQDPEAAEAALKQMEKLLAPEIRLSLPETGELAPGEETLLEAEISLTPEDAITPELAWSSSDTEVATVDTSGTVTATGPGRAVITVKSGDESAACSVTVAVFAEELSFESREITVGVGGNAALTPSVSPTDCTETLCWSSSDESVAKVDSSGSVTALREGQAVITLSGRQASAAYKVTVQKEAEAVSLSRRTLELEVGGSGALAAAVTPEDAGDQSILWETSDETVATVDAEGTVTAIAEGTAEITASCGTASAVCRVTVLPWAAQ